MSLSFTRLLQEVGAAANREEAHAILAAADLTGFSENQLCALEDACPESCATDEAETLSHKTQINGKT